MGFPKRKEAKNTIMLTSMMDMFTIILVFLLFNFSPDEQDAVNIPKDVSIPSSSSEELISEAVSVTVSQTSIMVDNKVVAKIRNGKHVQARLEGQKIVPLYNELLRHKRLNKFKSPSKQKGKSQEEDSSTVILLQADKRVPFELLDKVLKSAGMAGFPKSRFVVLRRES
ncbi:MAG: biopolymer transporter ExbD [Bdellovibrionales bacterium]|nr:biopolymer transporter ExbD [Bdellovibrionales bacterium]